MIILGSFWTQSTCKVLFQMFLVYSLSKSIKIRCCLGRGQGGGRRGRVVFELLWLYWNIPFSALNVLIPCFSKICCDLTLTSFVDSFFAYAICKTIGVFLGPESALKLFFKSVHYIFLDFLCIKEEFIFYQKLDKWDIFGLSKAKL